MRIFVSLLFLVVISQNSECQDQGKAILQQLEKAYQTKDTIAALAVFKFWNESITQDFPSSSFNNDTIHAIYSIFRELYKPFDLLTIGNWEWGNKLNSGCKYAIVQGTISWSIGSSDSLTDDDAGRKSVQTLNDFRPPLNLDKQQILFLKPAYEQAINQFLGTKSTKLGEGGIMNPSFPKGESEKRYWFIRPIIPVLHGHWGGYWHIATHPEISKIILNRKLTRALVIFRVGYQGGEARLLKNENHWEISTSKATWIE